MGFSNGVFSRIYNWTNDANAGIDILPGRMDTEDTGFASGLSTCILKDGTQVITANIPFAGFRLTNVGAATSLTDAIQATQVQNSSITWLGALSGTNTYTASTTPTFSAYVAGQKFSGLFTNGNTLGATLQINSISSPVTIMKKLQGGIAALVSGDIPSGTTVQLTYDGTNFIVDSVAIGTAASYNISGTQIAQDGSGNLSIVSSVPLGGNPTTTTQTAGDSSTKIATTAFVNSTALTLATGTVAVTKSARDNTTKVATTAYADAASHFGAWSVGSGSPNTITQAATDGFVVAFAAGTNGGITELNGITDSNSSPTTIIISNWIPSSLSLVTSVVFPVRKGDYWKVTGANITGATISWLPTGN